MARLEYKAVAMPQLMGGRRRRGQGSAEVIAEIVSKVINSQAERGWTYTGSDSYRAIERKQWWSRPEEVIYTVLLFQRETQAGARRPDADALPAPEAPRPTRPGFDPAVERRAPARGATFSVEDEEEEEDFPPARRPLGARPEPRRRAFDDRPHFDDHDDFDDRHDDFDDRPEDPPGGRFGTPGGRLRRPR